jgi:hypothetical protein
VLKLSSSEGFEVDSGVLRRISHVLTERDCTLHSRTSEILRYRAPAIEQQSHVPGSQGGWRDEILSP